jgi:hypothetical protein
VFLAANSDAPDTFAIAPLVNLEAGTVIHFTDNSRTGPGTGFADWNLRLQRRHRRRGVGDR